jgi:hypothetical protein
LAFYPTDPTKHIKMLCGKNSFFTAGGAYGNNSALNGKQLHVICRRNKTGEC